MGFQPRARKFQPVENNTPSRAIIFKAAVKLPPPKYAIPPRIIRTTPITKKTYPIIILIN